MDEASETPFWPAIWLGAGLSLVLARSCYVVFCCNRELEPSICIAIPNFSPPMSPPKGPPRVIGSGVHAKETAVKHIAECSRLHGSRAKTKLVNGKVLEVITEKINCGKSTSVQAEWVLIDVAPPKNVHKSCQDYKREGR